SFGTIWQKGYFDRALRREEDLKVMARYIIANPLRAGLVEHIGQYPLWDAIWL
ncbi:MAG: transposase, partial [Pseudomonas sp.]